MNANKMIRARLFQFSFSACVNGGLAARNTTDVPIAPHSKQCSESSIMRATPFLPTCEVVPHSLPYVVSVPPGKCSLIGPVPASVSDAAQQPSRLSTEGMRRLCSTTVDFFVNTLRSMSRKRGTSSPNVPLLPICGSTHSNLSPAFLGFRLSVVCFRHTR